MSKINKVFEKDIYSEYHKRYKEYKVDISFHIEIFFWFEPADPLDQYS